MHKAPKSMFVCDVRIYNLLNVQSLILFISVADILEVRQPPILS